MYQIVLRAHIPIILDKTKKAAYIVQANFNDKFKFLKVFVPANLDCIN